jgi:hypothetical protein
MQCENWLHMQVRHGCTEEQACQARRAAIQFKERETSRRVRVQLDDHLRQLLRELGHAINDTVGESDRITGAISNVRSAGYDIVLKLDATIGLAKLIPRNFPSRIAASWSRCTFKWTPKRWKRKKRPSRNLI